jgi:threonine dehydratase
MDETLPTVADVRRAAERLAGHAVRTPLLSSPVLDERIGGRVLLKCENLQRTGSFKFRGAYNAIAALSEAERARGIVAVSSGNHAQGVAEAARLFGARATIVMPADAPAIKRERTRRSGAVIVDYDRAREDRDAVAAKLIAAEGGMLVHPYDDRNVIAGQGTIGLEIIADARAMAMTPDAVLVPCSGGGLSAGVGLAVRSELPAAEIFLVEPEGFDDYTRSLREGRILANEKAAGSVSDSLLASSPGPIGFALNRLSGTAGLVVSDDEALAAVAFAFRELKLVVEPGGAVGLAAVLAGRLAVRGRTVVVVLSGGNIDEAMLARALAMPPSWL